MYWPPAPMAKTARKASCTWGSVPGRRQKLGLFSYCRHSRAPSYMSRMRTPSTRFMNVAEMALRTWNPGLDVA